MRSRFVLYALIGATSMGLTQTAAAFNVGGNTGGTSNLTTIKDYNNLIDGWNISAVPLAITYDATAGPWVKT